MSKKRSTTAFICMISLFLFFLPAFILSQTGQGWQAPPDVVERLTKNQPQCNYYEEKVPVYKLPELLVTLDGKKIENSDEWARIRRPEILELFRGNVYGRVPETPYNTTFRIVNKNMNAMEGAATLKEVDIVISSEGKSLTIRLSLFVPNNAGKKVPAFLSINNRGVEQADPSRTVKNEFWPAEEIVSRGYAAAVFQNSDVDPDNFDDFKNGIHGLLDRGERKGDSWGTIAAWAWGASRCMDYLVTDGDIDAGKVAVLGHSRGGKTALWAAAEDKRFAMAVSNESGCGGAALARRKFGETIETINRAFPHWFCRNYIQWGNNEDAMPVDMHMLLALIAPRAVYVTSASEDLWADPRGSYLSLYHSIPAFRLYDRNTALSEQMPPLNSPVSSGNTGYHVRDGVHNLLVKDWTWIMDMADKAFNR
ncbi:MAG: prolyl oligopeptidase family serine peptidase [Bacteroidales bacterium]|nr:prolyl oligopeptidase family serine peptidase [Bacteroidales bacterium]